MSEIAELKAQVEHLTRMVENLTEMVRLRDVVDAERRAMKPMSLQEQIEMCRAMKGELPNLGFQ